MSFQRYQRKLEQLRNEYHRKIVQGISLHDIQFDGWYRLGNPIIETLKSFDKEKSCYVVEPIEVKGLSWDGNIVAVDLRDYYVYLRYMDLSTENLRKIYKQVKKKNFTPVPEMKSGW